MNRSVYVPLCSLLLFVAFTGQTMGGVHGFLYSEGTFTTLDVPGSLSTSAYALNDKGQIVGGFAQPGEPGEAGQPGHAFSYTGGTFTIIDVPGSISHEAFGINDTGQIVGRFVDQAVVPEPSTWLLLGSGILALMYFRKRRAAS